MSHDLLQEQLLGLAAAAALLPGSRGANRISPATIFRWCTIGTKTKDGRRVRLESIRAGSRILTSREALRRYCEALNSNSKDEPTLPRSPIARQRASDRAAKELEEMGC